MNLRTFLYLVILGLFIQACGQTGPLYLPDDAPPIHVPEQEQ